MNSTQLLSPVKPSTTMQDPSPAEIRRECRRIQNEWSASERKERAAWRIPHWVVPIVKNEQPWLD